MIFYLWSLPGGGVEPEEDWAAAIREVREETGYEIAVDRLVGKYRRPQIGDTKYVFTGRICGGTPGPRPLNSKNLTRIQAHGLSHVKRDRWVEADVAWCAHPLS